MNTVVAVVTVFVELVTAVDVSDEVEVTVVTLVEVAWSVTMLVEVTPPIVVVLVAVTKVEGIEPLCPT